MRIGICCERHKLDWVFLRRDTAKQGNKKVLKFELGDYDKNRAETAGVEVLNKT